MSDRRYQVYLEVPDQSSGSKVSSSLPTSSDVHVATYLRGKGHSVEWYSKYEDSLFIDDIEVRITDYFYLFNNKVYGSISKINEALAYVSTQTSPTVNNGLVSVTQYFQDKGYLVEELPEVPRYIFINGISFYVGMFVSKQGTPVIEPRSLDQNVYEYYAPDSFLYELESLIPETFDDALSKYSKQELKAKIRQYNEPAVETYSANSEAGLNKLISTFESYIKEDDPNINFVIEEINQR